MQTTAAAIENLLRGLGDPLGDVRHIRPGHREWHAALILRAAVGVIAKVPAALPSIRAALRRIDPQTASPAALAHAGAARAWAGGDPVRAAEAYAAIARASPWDLLALRLAQSCYFFLGRHDGAAAIGDAVLAGWTGSAAGLQFALAMSAFAHAENGDTAYAEALGRRALVLESACPLGVHAVAHAYAESGRHRAGAHWMREQHAHWATQSRMRSHNAWHLAMFDAESGHLGGALAILDDWLMPACEGSVLDACDAAALLWRLGLGGVDEGGRWRRLSNAFEKRAPGFWPYIDLNAGFAHLASGQGARAGRLARAVERAALGDDYAALRARRITLPGLKIFAALADGRRDEAARRYAALRPLLGEAGGSRVQLEMFYGIEEADRLGRVLTSSSGIGPRRAARAA
jgi:hypothetical protein